MNTFLLLFNAFPAVLQSVQAVETAIPMSQSGQQKMNLILGVAATAWEIGETGIQLTQSNPVAAIQTIANLTVATLNAVGVFKHAAPAVPASAATAPVSSN
jgi:hypothetical protein